MDQETRIATLLARAGAAHDETDAGEEEENDLAAGWPLFYARYALSHGLGELLARPPAESELAELLTEAAEAHEADPAGASYLDTAARAVLRSFG